MFGTGCLAPGLHAKKVSISLEGTRNVPIFQVPFPSLPRQPSLHQLSLVDVVPSIFWNLWHIHALFWGKLVVVGQQQCLSPRTGHGMASFPTLSPSSGTALIQTDATYYLLRFVSPSEGRSCSSCGRARPKPNPISIPFFP